MLPPFEQAASAITNAKTSDTAMMILLFFLIVFS
ncbi:MAG: sortase B protein-sorting domain-containing protein [Eubacterium sp.]|nr:sortase B protein-sorting domain-containing protein [Eubacterium sp.]MBR1530523.1 sortase B protein-sorting domain-containing protein [Eubacterium sp.]